MKFSDAASADRFYVLVTDVARRYVRARFQVEAPGRTTREIAKALEAITSLSEDQKKSLAGLLARADLVKFAKVCPPPHATESFVTEVRQFILETAK